MKNVSFFEGLKNHDNISRSKLNHFAQLFEHIDRSSFRNLVLGHQIEIMVKE